MVRLAVVVLLLARASVPPAGEAATRGGWPDGGEVAIRI